MALFGFIFAVGHKNIFFLRAIKSLKGDRVDELIFLVDFADERSIIFIIELMSFFHDFFLLINSSFA